MSRIVIEAGPGLGDLVMLTPALRRLKELCPETELVVLSNESSLPLVQELPYVDGVIGLKRGKFLGRWRSGAALYGADKVIFTTWQPQLAVMAWLLRVPERIGVCKRRGREKLFTKLIKGLDNYSDSFRADALAEVIGGALGLNLLGNPCCEVSQPTEKILNRVRKMLCKAGLIGDEFVVLLPYGKTELSFPKSLSQGIVQFLQKEKIPCVVMDSERRQDDCFAGAINLTGQTSLLELMAVLKLSRAAVAIGSGPLHMACALGTPTVAVFSTDLPKLWAPKKHCHVITLSEACSPCKRSIMEKCPHKRCINGITAAMVTGELQKLLEK